MLGICTLSVPESCMKHCYKHNINMLWREKERSRIMAVQMDNPREPLGIRRMDRVPNARSEERSR